ncbi:MAG: hypothetical protein KIT89_07105 [Microcella sp.]|uniref:hypothetical protein n=1 Tax=Microcella sp. TaxID=1913979 RepID=UPI0024C9D5CD|nr:hypothetical protein [Microcella sp.]UYN82529.1 MAG: hypothetical protein KIT89_07105 [Microcella sp.]
MTQTPAATAAQHASSTPADRARRYRDPRLVIGLALVTVSVAAVVGIVSFADEGHEVLAAPRLLVEGERVQLAELEPRRVVLGVEGHGYLTAADVPDAGLVVTRTVGQGELVPLSAVGDERGPRSTTVVVRLSTALGATVRPGDRLDLWAAPALDAGRFGAPVVIASGTQLVRTIAAEGIVSASEAGRVELLIPRRDVARILHALANGDALSAIPASLAIGG